MIDKKYNLKKEKEDGVNYPLRCRRIGNICGNISKRCCRNVWNENRYSNGIAISIVPQSLSSPAVSFALTLTVYVPCSLQLWVVVASAPELNGPIHSVVVLSPQSMK